MEREHKINIIISVLLAVLILVTGLLFTKFLVIKEIINTGRQNLAAIKADFAGQNQVKLISPIFKTTDPVKGTPAAGNIVFIFGSFTCQYCQQEFAELNSLFTKYPNKFYLIWKDLASELDTAGRAAALAARCAQAQNKFWPYAEALFANQENLGPDLYQSLAGEHGLDLTAFNSCLSSQEQLSVIESDLAEAVALGIDASPYLFVNGKSYSGGLSATDLEKIMIK